MNFLRGLPPCQFWKNWIWHETVGGTRPSSEKVEGTAMNTDMRSRLWFTHQPLTLFRASLRKTSFLWLVHLYSPIWSADLIWDTQKTPKTPKTPPIAMALVSENFQNKIRKHQFCQMKQTECCLDIENGASIHQFSWLIQIEQTAIAVCVLAGRKSIFSKYIFQTILQRKTWFHFIPPRYL